MFMIARNFFLASLLMLPLLAYPFGLKTHIWIAKNVLAEISTSCVVSIGPAPLSIDREVCRSVREHPKAFLAGALGPDAYPDIITGQVTTHPGIAGDWQTADWLMHVYSRAAPGPRLAFAAGYLVHAASDVFAHTYVNAYSGDVFSLGDERAVERRHFVLEKYIDAHLPQYKFSKGEIDAPEEWLRDKLIHNKDAARNSAKSRFALHIAAMNGLYLSVTDLRKVLDGIERDAGRLLAEIAAVVIDANAKALTGETQLKAAREALSLNEGKLNAEQAIYDALERALQDAIKAVEGNKSLIGLRAAEAQAARNAIQLAQRVSADALTELNRFQDDLKAKRNQIISVPTEILSQVCKNEIITPKNVCEAACGFNIICRSKCKDIEGMVCRAIKVVNTEYTKLASAISSLEKAVDAERGKIERSTLEVAAQTAIEATKLKEKIDTESQTAALEAARTAIEGSFKLQRAKLDIELLATQEAKRTADRLAIELEGLRKKLVDAQAIRDAIADAVARSDILSGVAKNWLRGMDLAGKEFIVVGTKIIEGMLAGNSNFAMSYQDWLKCYGHAYGGIPIQFGQASCAFEDFMGKIDLEAQKIAERSLPPPFGELYGRLLGLKATIRSEIRAKASEAAVELAKLAAPDAVSRDFIDLIAEPASANRDKLNEVFSTPAGASGKPLLSFPKVSELVDADLGLKAGELNPRTFYALRNAVTLSKLALADVRSVRRLIQNFGGNPNALKAPTVEVGKWSILFDMVRSIDGNHQWQPYGLPYPSANGVEPRPKDASARRFGYGPGQERPGFILFVDQSLRKKVFLKIFAGPMSGSIAAHLSGYPFPECLKNRFPVSFLPDGRGALDDLTCK